MKDCVPENGQSSGKPCRVLILGGGFGGIYTALELQKRLRRRKDVTVTLLSRYNFFLFTPMLHEVATSDLEINTIISPLHKLLSRVADLRWQYRSDRPDYEVGAGVTRSGRPLPRLAF